MPATPAQARKLALKLRPERGPERGVLMDLIDAHRGGWPDLEEEDVEHMMQATLAGLGELPPNLWFGVETPAVLPCLSGGVRLLGNCPVRHKGSCIGCISVAVVRGLGISAEHRGWITSQLATHESLQAALCAKQVAQALRRKGPC